MMTKTKRLSTLASASFDENSRPLGAAAVDMAKRFCVIPVPWRAWLVGLGLAVGIILTTGGSAIADPHKPPPCTSVVNGGTVFEILDNQTYALCAASSCTVFNEVAYCKCDVLSGDSISLALDFDTDQNVCTVNMDGVKNGYMVSTFSPPASVFKGGDQASYTCPGATPTKAGSDGAYAQCDGGICFKSTQGQSSPFFDETLAKDEIICSCPITQQSPTNPVGYNIVGPYPNGHCDPSFFENCNTPLPNSSNGFTLFVGAPAGTGDLLAFLLTGSVPESNRCLPPP